MKQSQMVGIDRRDACFFVAGVTYGTGRPEIRTLAKLDSVEIGERRERGEERTVLSVPDAQVVVKQLRLDPQDSIDLAERVHFELARSMLEPPDRFHFGLLANDNDQYQIGLVYRRDRLKDLLPEYGVNEDLDGIDYLVRAAALGQGYLNFCRHVPGELVALADLADDCLSICFVHHRRIVELAHTKLGSRDQFSHRDLNRIAVDLKTVVNFKLASLRDRGVSLPLAALVLNGSWVNEEVRQVFGAYFPAGVSEPQVHRGLISEQIDLKGTAPESYLVALGLTAN